MQGGRAVVFFSRCHFDRLIPDADLENFLRPPLTEKWLRLRVISVYRDNGGRVCYYRGRGWTEAETGPPEVFCKAVLLRVLPEIWELSAKYRSRGRGHFSAHSESNLRRIKSFYVVPPYAVTPIISDGGCVFFVQRIRD